MPAPAKYHRDDLLDAALALFVDGGLSAVTVAGVARRAGAPSGSLYHRFPSRDALLASLWVRTVERFQEGYLAALRSGDPHAAVRGAVHHVLRWARSHPAEALLLLAHRADAVLATELPATLEERRRATDRALASALAEIRRRLPEEIGEARLRFALIDLPYALVRPYLAAGRPPPHELDDLVDEVLAAVMPTPRHA